MTQQDDVGKTLSKHEIQEYLRRNILTVQRGNITQYIDTSDNQIISFEGLVGMVCSLSKFSLDHKAARELLRGFSVNPWSGREEYRPDHPNTKVLNINHKWVLNTYRRSKIKPNPEMDPQPFVEHIHRAVNDKVAAEFLLDVVAYRYQNLYINDSFGKPAHALYIYSVAQGQGKSLFTDTITKVFGDSAVKDTTQADALIKQNGYQFWERTWLLVDEVKVKDRTRLYDNLKARISKIKDTVDPKNKASIEVMLPAQLIMTSNHIPDFIEPDDRRFCIVEWDTGLRSENEKREYFDAYIHWLMNGGYEAIAGLLKTRDLSNYNPTSPPPPTEAKARAIVASEPTEVDDLRQLMNEHEDVYVFDHDSISRLRLPNRGQQELLHKAGLYKKRIQTKEGQKVTLYIRQDYEVRAGNIFDTEKKQLVCSLKDNLKRLSPF